MASDYRLSPALCARLVGVALAGLAVLIFVATALVAALRWSPMLLVGVSVVGVVLIGAGGFWLTRRAYVVRLGEAGYRVRFVRGAGVTGGRWTDVEDAVTTTVGGSPCVVLRLRDGGTTTIPVEALAADREQFARDLRRHLQDGQGLRPL